MDEKTLIEKLLKIEALFSGAATEGERVSAELARERILQRLKKLLLDDPPIEYKFTFPDMWSRKVFVTLLRRYNLQPYRYPRQRYTTVIVQVPQTFVDETLWPEFQEINKELQVYLQEVTDRIVKEVLHEDSSDAVVVDQPLQIDIVQEPMPANPATELSENNPDKMKKPGNPKNKNRKKKKKRKR